LPSFQQEIRKLTHELLLQGQSEYYLDWRILKKMLSAPELFAFSDKGSCMGKMIEAVQKRLDIAEEMLFWHIRGETDRWAKDFLRQLKDLLIRRSDLFEQALVTGRLDKKDSGFRNTILFGEHGGIFALLNSLHPSERTTLEQIMGAEYINTKM
jgi:hypothetical protein